MQFWRQLFLILKHNPRVINGYLATCAILEHLIDYREIARREIEAQLAIFPEHEPASSESEVKAVQEEEPQA